MKLFSILFCISVVCVFVLADKGDQHKPVKHVYERNHKIDTRHQQHGHHAQQFLYRAGSDSQECRWVCVPDSPNSSGGSLEIHYKGNSSLIAILNKSSNIVILIDYSSQLIGLLNGETGEAIIINARLRNAYKITYNSNSEKYLWLVSKTSFDVFWKDLSSLQQVYNIAKSQGQRININASQEISSIFSQFGTSLTSQETFNLLVSFISRLQGNLKFLYQGSGSFSTQQSLQWFLNVNAAFGDLLNDANGNIKNSDIWNHLNLTTIFNASSGAESLLSFLSQIGSSVDLARTFSAYFTSPQKALSFLEEISGGSHDGLDGFITIIVNIIQTIEGRGSINKIISSIINYNASAIGNNDNLTTIINEATKLAESQGRRFDSSARWEGFIKILQSLNDHNLIFRNVNISDIIKLLRWYRPSEAISTIIKIFSKFLPSNGIPQFFRFILNLLNSTDGSGVLRRLLPGIDLSNFTGSGNILEQIFRGQNLTELLSHPCNISSLFSQLPVFGPIIQTITKTLGDRFDINRFFNASTISSIFGGGSGLFGGLLNGSGIASTFTHGIENAAHGFQDGIVNFFNSISSLGGSLGEGGSDGGSNSGGGQGSSGGEGGSKGGDGGSGGSSGSGGAGGRGEGAGGRGGSGGEGGSKGGDGGSGGSSGSGGAGGSGGGSSGGAGGRGGGAGGRGGSGGAGGRGGSGSGGAGGTGGGSGSPGGSGGTGGGSGGGAGGSGGSSGGGSIEGGGSGEFGSEGGIGWSIEGGSDDNSGGSEGESRAKHRSLKHSQDRKGGAHQQKRIQGHN